MKPVKHLLTSLLLATSLGVSALDSDINQPVDVKSDHSNADIQKGVLVYSGRVRISQGTMLIKADELQAKTNDKKVLKVLIATGNPATYEQMMENGKLAKAEANEIRYDVAQRTLTLSGGAQMSQAGSLVTGDIIRYDLDKQQLDAQGTKDQQITTTFQPAAAEKKSSESENEPQ
ncbi:lipopolysaccharide transport periplasmic protein LptA [Ferrimonas aestuarii]|nr:lipopolysaccharide transport periplasmic protein LptA [Ferrimonas aestuarii]